jgi:hypothetical protein
MISGHEPTGTTLQDFLRQNGRILTRIAGGAAVLAVLTTAAADPAMARSHGFHGYHSSHSTHSYHSGGSSHWFSPWKWAFWRSHSSSTAGGTIDDAKKAIENEAPIETLQHNIDARRVLLEDAVNSLQALKDAVENADGLDADDRAAAIKQASDRYNVDVRMLDLNVETILGKGADTPAAATARY